MTSIELDWFHSKLLEVKSAEKEAHEKAMQSVRANRTATPTRRSYRKRR